MCCPFLNVRGKKLSTTTFISRFQIGFYVMRTKNTLISTTPFLARHKVLEFQHMSQLESLPVGGPLSSDEALRLVEAVQSRWYSSSSPGASCREGTDRVLWFFLAGGVDPIPSHHGTGSPCEQTHRPENISSAVECGWYISSVSV